MFPYPQVAAPRLHNARKGLHKALCRFVQSPPESHTYLAWMIREILDPEETAKVEINNKASIIQTLLWM